MGAPTMRSGLALAAAAGLWLVVDARGQSTSRASVGPLGAEGNAHSAAPAISAGGTRVAFQSLATNLDPGATNPFFDVYVRDVAAGTTSLASVSPGGAEGTGGSYTPALSANGRWIVFQSWASNLGPTDVNPLQDVYVRDLVTGAMALVNVDSAGVQPAIGDTGGPAISWDGRFVAFDSTATSLVPGDSNGARDVFVRDRVAGTTVRASVDSAGNEGAGFSSAASISRDGRFVAFQSAAANLVPGDTNGSPDVFVRDLVAGTTVRVSVGAGGAQADGPSYQAEISADGRVVAFASTASNLVPGDLNGFADVFVRDLAAGTTSRISVQPGGGEGDGGSGEELAYAPISISADGRFVAFESRAGNLVPVDMNNASDVFVHDRVTGRTTLESVAVSGMEGDGASYAPSISADGRRVAFESAATNLVANDTNNLPDVFVRDRGASSAFVPFCSTGACPCGNQGLPGHGCQNSAGTGGAHLSAVGEASLASDSVVLTATGERPSALSIVLQGTRAIAPVAFGDGLRCAGGTLKRLYVKSAVAGTVVAPGTGDPSITARSAALGDAIGLGATRVCQVHYRDGAPGFCPAPAGSSFNATNAVAVAWGE